jgi:hypothetical protein
VYVSSLTGGFRVFAQGPGDADIDLGVQAAIGTWYHVSMELAVAAGTVRSRISVVETGETLIDRVDTLSGWDPQLCEFDTVLFFDGELSPMCTAANLAVVDNVSWDVADFFDGFEAGDTSKWAFATP